MYTNYLCPIKVKRNYSFTTRGPRDRQIKPGDMKHTPTPWMTRSSARIIWAGDRLLASTITANNDGCDSVNARRIVACVNACEGIETSALESGGTIVADLLEELERTVEFIKNYGNHKCLQSIKFCVHCLLLSEASAAIAKAKGVKIKGVENGGYSDAELNCKGCFGPCGACEEPAPAPEPPATTEFPEHSAGWWFQKLPEPYRGKAIANTAKRGLYLVLNSLDEAIDLAFDWGETAQGADYWHEIHKRACKGEFVN